MINNVVLVGRLIKDVDLRYTGSGIAVASFIIAVNRSFTTNDGQDADFINCVVWRKTAENMANYTRKGSLIGIAGRIQTRNHTNNDNQKVYVTEVVAENVQFLEPKSNRNEQNDTATHNHQQNNQNATAGNSGTNNSKAQNDAAMNNWQENVDERYNANDPVNISDDDLPF